MNVEVFSLMVIFVSAVILLFVSFLAFLSLKLRRFKQPLILVMVAAICMTHASLMDLVGGERYLADLVLALSILLLAVAFYLITAFAREIGLAR